MRVQYTLTFETSSEITPGDRRCLKERLGDIVRLSLLENAPVAIDQREAVE